MSILKPIDRQVIKTLGAGRLSASEMARKTGLRRTTLQYRLKMLLREGMISRSKIVGRKILYSVNRRAVNEARESRLVEVFTGPNIVHAYRYFFEAPKHAVVYSVQGYEAIRKIIKILPTNFLENAHRKQKSRNIILKGFVNKKALSLLKEFSLKTIQSHANRAIGVKLIEGDILMGACEILCSRTVFLLSDTKKRRVVVFREKAIANFLYEIFSMLYDSSDNVGIFRLNDFLQGLASTED